MTDRSGDETKQLTRLRGWLPWLAAIALLILAIACVEALRHLTAELHYQEVVSAVRGTSNLQLAGALLAAALSYFALTGYDRSALQYIHANVPYRIIGQTSFIAYALSNTIGLGMLTGGTVRMRLYGAAGIEPARVARVIAFNSLAFGLGITVAGCVALLLAAPTLATVAHVPAWLLRTIAAVVLSILAWLLWNWRRGGQQRLWRFSFEIPSLSLVGRQLLISCVDIGASAAVLWILLPAGAIDFVSFLALYAAATALGVLSHLPGGIGVFEAVMLAALGDHVPANQLAGALVLYRLIYYVCPLGFALTWLVLHESHRARDTPVVRAMASLTPTLLAAMTVVIGTMLLISGALPATDEATDLLELHVPLPLVEAAHFLGSIAGLALLFVARGMLLRLDAAWWAGLALGLISLVLSIPKGIALTEAAILAAFVVLLTASRKRFTRRASLFSQPFSVGWTAAISVTLVAVLLLILFVYRDVDYTNELWWRFEFDAHAPRSLRAMVAVTLLALVLALRQLFRLAPAPHSPAELIELERSNDIVRQQDSADAVLALLGDKQLLFSESGRSFVMYGRRGGSWVALFDPVGPAREAPEMIWRFLEKARESGGRASFYQVRPEYLPHYLDAGLRMLKLGEYASVPLPQFSLKGSNRASLRQGMNRAERDGLTFEIIAVERVPEIIDEMHAVSDAWLDEHHTAEKGFSLGSFEHPYVLRQPAAVVRKEGQMTAFATLMVTDRRSEASVDLMRHLPAASRGTMDFLFVKLLLHFQAEGYQRFGLGMAPLSGMASHPLASRWHRIGHLLFAHGENFYNFQGLRAFKEKFDPDWQPRYLAAPGVVAPLFVLLDTAALISGGLRALVVK